MSFIYKWIGTFLGWLDSLTGSYLFALFLFALIVEALMLPFAIKQQKNTIKQASLRPKELAIRKKYAGRNDQATQQKMSQEIQEMYQKEGYNMMGGCLPLLIQLPIIMILYNVVINPLQYVCGVSSEAISALNTFLGESATKGSIALLDKLGSVDLGAFGAVEGNAAFAQEFTAAIDKGLPNFKFLGLNLADTPSIGSPSWLLVIPALTFIVYFASMKLSRKMSYQPTDANGKQDKQAGCSNAVMDVSMPLMSVFITFTVPATIGVYWIFKSMLGTLKQFIVSRAMPLPKFTEEDYRAAEKEYAGKTGKNRSAKVNFELNQSNPNSIARLDDEDYVTAEDMERLREKLDPKPVAAESDEPSADGEHKREESISPVGDAPLKDESDKPVHKNKRRFGEKKNK